jgi:hypothetical protein
MIKLANHRQETAFFTILNVLTWSPLVVAFKRLIFVRLKEVLHLDLPQHFTMIARCFLAKNYNGASLFLI